MFWDWGLCKQCIAKFFVYLFHEQDVLIVSSWLRCYYTYQIKGVLVMYDVTHHESYKVASDWIKATNMVSRQNDNAVFLASRECSVFNTIYQATVPLVGPLTLASSSTLKFPR